MKYRLKQIGMTAPYGMTVEAEPEKAKKMVATGDWIYDDPRAPKEEMVEVKKEKKEKVITGFDETTSS